MMTPEWFELSTLEWTLAGALAGLFIIQLLYFLFIYRLPSKYIKKSGGETPAAVATGEEQALPPVSIIVYTRNEFEDLQKNLPILLSQHYPTYEVIVVKDSPSDESDDTLKRFQQQYKNLYHTYIPEGAKYLSRKKLALTIGVKAAKYDLLLFTEAGCHPATEHWITSFARQYDADTEIVLGYSAHEPAKGFFRKLAAYDHLKDGLKYLSAAIRQRPFMGDGNNLSYRKALFFSHKGYYKTLSLHAGYDDLFVNETANRKNTKVVLSPDSLTQLAPLYRYKAWKNIKISKAATSRYYKHAPKFFFLCETLSYYLFLLTVAALIVLGLLACNPIFPALAVLFLLLRYAVVLSVFTRTSKQLQQKPNRGWIPLFEFIIPIYNLYVKIYRLFRGKKDYTFYLNNKQ